MEQDCTIWETNVMLIYPHVHITSAALRNRMVLETAGTLRKHSKSELEKNGIHINQGFDGRYCFWEMDSETINRYVTSLKSQVK